MSSRELTTESGSGSGELSEFLLELSIAVNRHAVYPDSHPSLSGSAQGVIERLEQLFRERSTVSIGVARRQLIIEGVATDENHPVLRSVAERLHRQHIGAITFLRGADAEELRSTLRLLTVEAEQLEVPLGLGDAAKLRQAEHIRLYPLTYGNLELIEDVDGEAGGGVGGGGTDTQASQLWVGLAHAAMAQEDGDAPAETDSAVIAQAINEHEAAPAYDQVIVGYLLQLATQLRETGATTGRAVRTRLSGLITRLDEGTLRRLVAMGGDFAQRQRFVLDATETLAADSVLEVLKAAAQSSDQTISNSMLRMLTKLSANAVDGIGGGVADEAMREQVRELISGWSLRDPNPENYTRALEDMARATSPHSLRVDDYPAEPVRLIEMALEVDAMGAAVERAASTLLREGRAAELVDLLDAAPQNATVDALWQRVLISDELRVWLVTDPMDFGVLDRVLPRLPDASVISLLLDRISESESRSTRMGVFQRLASRGNAITAQVVERLRDGRWFVQRNMLALLNEIGEYPGTLSALQYARHDAAMVRREAIQLALTSHLDHERAMCLAFADDDERTVRIGIRAAQDGIPASALPLALRCLDNEAFSPELRAQLLRVLRPIRTNEVMERMLSLVVTGKTMIMGRPKLAARSPEFLQALSTLAGSWPTHPRVAPVLQRARETGEAEVLRALRGDESA